MENVMTLGPKGDPVSLFERLKTKQAAVSKHCKLSPVKENGSHQGVACPKSCEIGVPTFRYLLWLRVCPGTPGGGMGARAGARLI